MNIITVSLVLRILILVCLLWSYPQDRVMVSLTSLLVLVSLFSQTSNNIPKTAYMKLVDIWFLALIVMDFFVILIVVIIEHIRLREIVPIKEAKNTKFIQISPFPSDTGKLVKTNLNLNDNFMLENQMSSNKIVVNGIKKSKIDSTVIKINAASKYGFPVIYIIFIFVFGYKAVMGIM